MVIPQQTPKLIGEILQNISPANVIGNFSQTERVLANRQRDLNDELAAEKHGNDRLNQSRIGQGSSPGLATIEAIKTSARRLGKIGTDRFTRPDQ